MRNQILQSIFIFFALLFVKQSTAQKCATFDAGQAFTTFRFKDSEGNKEKNLSTAISGCYSFSYQDTILKQGLFFPEDGLFYRVGLSMRKAGASMVSEALGANWNLQYVDLNGGLGYMYNKWRLKPYFYLSPYFAYMIKGTQTNGPLAYDIKQSKSMKTTDFGLLLAPGAKVTLSDYISIYSECKYNVGLQNIETTSEEKSYNRGFSINIGVAVTITKLEAGNKRVQSTL